MGIFALRTIKIRLTSLVFRISFLIAFVSIENDVTQDIWHKTKPSLIKMNRRQALCVTRTENPFTQSYGRSNRSNVRQYRVRSSTIWLFRYSNILPHERSNTGASNFTCLSPVFLFWFARNSFDVITIIWCGAEVCLSKQMQSIGRGNDEEMIADNYRRK